MKHRYLEVTFRKGNPVAAYLYLPRRAGAKSAGTLDLGDGLRADLDDTGTAIGIEMIDPSAVTLEGLNAALGRLGFAALDEDDLRPLRAA